MSNYSYEGPAWSGSVVTYSFAPAGGVFTSAMSAAYQQVVQAAIARWQQVTNLTFQQVADSSSANIRIGWGSVNGNLANNQIGQTDYTYKPSTNKFSNGMTVRIEDPSIDYVAPTNTAKFAGTNTTLYQVALHEFGHALGLGLSDDTNAVMNIALGGSNTDIDASDIAGIQALYGVPANSPAISAATTSAATTTVPDAVNVSGGIAVYRFFDSHSGTQFLTGSLEERNTLITTRPDMHYEGLGMGGVANGSTDPNAVSVFRFFDTSNGTHFFTSSATEAATLASSRPDMINEGASFMEHATAEAGDTAVYRFFDTSKGTHFFTNSATEQASLISTRPDMAYEGIAFYAPSH